MVYMQIVILEGKHTISHIYKGICADKTKYISNSTFTKWLTFDFTVWSILLTHTRYDLRPTNNPLYDQEGSTDILVMNMSTKILSCVKYVHSVLKIAKLRTSNILRVFKVATMLIVFNSYNMFTLYSLTHAETLVCWELYNVGLDMRSNGSKIMLSDLLLSCLGLTRLKSSLMRSIT